MLSLMWACAGRWDRLKMKSDFMKRMFPGGGVALACLTMSHGRELTGHSVLLQPIVLTDDEGKGAAKVNLPEELIDRPFRRWDLDFHILEPIHWPREKFRDGGVDVDVIVKTATEERVFREPGRIANVFFAKKINGKAAPNGLGQQPGWVTFIAQGEDPPVGQDAFVVVHEVSHNLGLAHTVDDGEVAADIPNVMGDGEFLDRIREDGITRHQAATMLKSPLVRETVRCLRGEEARRAYLDENFEQYYSRLNRREVEAMTGRALPEGLAGKALEKEARKRFSEAVVDFTPEEREVVRWMVDGGRVSQEFGEGVSVVGQSAVAGDQGEAGSLRGVLSHARAIGGHERVGAGPDDERRAEAWQNSGGASGSGEHIGPRADSCSPAVFPPEVRRSLHGGLRFD